MDFERDPVTGLVCPWCPGRRGLWTCGHHPIKLARRIAELEAALWAAKQLNYAYDDLRRALREMLK